MKRFLLVFVLFLGCASQKPVVLVSNQAGDVNKAVEMDENFDPSTINDYELKIPQEKSPSITPLDIDNFLKGDETLLNTEGYQEQGYRVQLISTREEAEARAVRKDAILTFDEKIYLQYDDPYYKVRIGDFISRYAANDFQELALQKGFPEAWVVRTIVFVAPETIIPVSDSTSNMQ